jgi:hypothetical protein
MNCLLVWVDCVSWVILEMELGDVEDRQIVINCSKSFCLRTGCWWVSHKHFDCWLKNINNGFGHVLSWHSWMCGGIYNHGTYDFWSQLCPWEPSVLNSKMCRLHCNWVSYCYSEQSCLKVLGTLLHCSSSLEGLSVFFRIEKSSEEWDACWLTQNEVTDQIHTTYIIFSWSICQELEWESVEV